MKEPTLKERQRARRHEEILDVAAGLFMERGFSAVTFEEVASAALTSKPTLYSHFQSKEDLAVGLAVREMRRVSDYLASQDDRLPAGERLSAFMDWVLEFRFGKESAFIVSLTQFVSPLRREGSELVEEEAAMLRRLAALICQAQDGGAVRGDVDPVCVSALMLSGHHGYLDQQVSSGALTTADIAHTWRTLLMPNR